MIKRINYFFIPFLFCLAGVVNGEVVRQATIEGPLNKPYQLEKINGIFATYHNNLYRFTLEPGTEQSCKFEDIRFLAPHSVANMYRFTCSYGVAGAFKMYRNVNGEDREIPLHIGRVDTEARRLGGDPDGVYVVHTIRTRHYPDISPVGLPLDATIRLWHYLKSPEVLWGSLTLQTFETEGGEPLYSRSVELLGTTLQGARAAAFLSRGAFGGM